jgi:hypothetical protein
MECMQSQLLALAATACDRVAEALRGSPHQAKKRGHTLWQLGIKIKSRLKNIRLAQLSNRAKPQKQKSHACAGVAPSPCSGSSTKAQAMRDLMGRPEGYRGLLKILEFKMGEGGTVGRLKLDHQKGRWLNNRKWSVLGYMQK